MLKLSYIFMTIVGISGCAMGGLVNISEPHMAKEHGSYIIDSSGIIHHSNIEISVKPETYKVGLLAAGPLIPVVPLGSGNDFNRQKTRFKIVLQFDPKGSTISFAPNNSHLLINHKFFSPISFEGPLNDIVGAREVARSIPGHSWVCQKDGDYSSSMGVALKHQITITEKSCVIIEFPMITPDTSSEFQLHLEGFKIDGKEIETIQLFFKPSTRSTYSLMG